MRAFKFSLHRVLEWRRTQLELRENELCLLLATLEELALAAKRLELVKSRAESAACHAAVVEARDLWALASYRQRVISELQVLAARRAACERQVEQQRQKLLGARRECLLLEKLEERHLEEWQKEADREIETLAAESFLARWSRSAH